MAIIGGKLRTTIHHAIKSMQNLTFDDIFHIRLTLQMGRVNQNFKYTKRKKQIEVYSGRLCGLRKREMAVAVNDNVTCVTKCSFLRLFYVLYFSQISFLLKLAL